MNLFENLFGIVGDLYNNAVMPIGIMLLLMILVWQLFKSMFGKTGIASEDPLELIFRSAVCLILIAYAKQVVNYILELAGTPYQWVMGTSITVDSFSEYISASEAAVSVLGIDSMSINLLLLIMQFVVAWNYFKMLFILAERYVLLGVFSYTAPLAFATGGSKSTNGILASWVKMFGGQVLIVILDVWCVKMFLSAYGNLMVSSYGFTKFFAATMCLIGFCKITAKLDSYMGSLGVNLGRTGGGLGGLGALMMAGRLLRAGTGLGSPSAAKAGTGDGKMNFGTGKGIPLGNPGKGATAASHGMTAPQGAGIGGMAPTPGGEVDMSPKSFEQSGMEDMPFMDGSSFGANQNESLFPFGNPDESEAFGPGEISPEDETNANITADAGDLISGQDFGESDMLPSMDMEGEERIHPFGDSEQTEVTATKEAAGISGIPGLEPEWQENEVGENLSDRGTSYGGTEEVSSLSGIMDDVLSAASFAEETAESGIDSAGIDVPGGYSSIEAGEAVSSVGSDSVALNSNGGMKTEQAVTVPGFSGTLENLSAGNFSQEFATGENSVNAASSRSSDSSMGFSSYQEGFTHGTEGRVGEYGRAVSAETAMDSGIYPINRDGERYMRYDAAKYEKPKSGEYQTIHENGKTFYELPGNGPAPAMLPEVKAKVEKDGTLHLEKTYQKDQGFQREIRTVPDYHAGRNAERTENVKQRQPRRRPQKETSARNKKQRTDQS